MNDVSYPYLGLRLPAILLVVWIAFVLFACTRIQKEKEIPMEASIAFFDDFVYIGEDLYYEQNPLPGPDYYFNPILPGWYSDPSICSNGEDYFLVTSTFVYFPGVPIFHSTDLVNWKQIGHVLDRESQLVNMEKQHTSGGIFAPAISYNPHNQTYYMITTNVGAGNFFVKTKDPFGSWSDPVFLPDVGGIDPSFFFDDDGKAYIVNNDDPEGKPKYDGHRAIRIRSFDVEKEVTFGPEKVLVDGGIHPEKNPIWIEGPHMYKINGMYYLMAAEGGTSIDHSEVILRGKHPMGPFKAWGKNPILTQRHLNPARPNPITCAGHADLIQTKEGDWWSVFLACRPIDGKFENLGRETFLMPVLWSDDGFPYMTQGDDLIPMIVRREGVSRNEEVTFGNFGKTDDFNEPVLGMDWLTLRSSAKNLYTLEGHPGYLALKCTPVRASERAVPAFVCRRIQHHTFTATTKLVFHPADESERAGLLLYKDEGHQYFLSVQNQGKDRKIALEKVGRQNTEILFEKTLPRQKNPIHLKVASTGTQFGFYYAEKEQEWMLLCDQIDAHYLSTANSFGFTGTTIGLYAEKRAGQP
ncbi:MAG TPA: glycoside hydrolase family 43 protein [Prolixibacteraceae bacterium]|nr:glycoside hydrolase family 43 protein [Prolixibacteraceae bacterium]